MGLFRPYEQGDSKKAESTDETVTAEPVSSTESSPSSATAAPRPTSDAANTKQEKHSLIWKMPDGSASFAT